MTRQAARHPPRLPKIHGSCSSLKEHPATCSETARSLTTRQNQARTAPPDGPRPPAETEKANWSKNSTSLRQEKQTRPWKTSLKETGTTSTAKRTPCVTRQAARHPPRLPEIHGSCGSLKKPPATCSDCKVATTETK